MKRRKESGLGQDRVPKPPPRAANPAINVIARAHSDAEVEHLKGLGADIVIMGEREIARAIVEVVTGKTTDRAGPAMEINPQPA